MNPFSSAQIIGEGVDPAVYHRHGAKRGDPEFIMSRSELMEFVRCPSRWIKGFESPETKSTEWGTLMDCLVLAKERFHSDYAICPQTYPDAKTGAPKKWNWNANYCEEWKANQGGRLPIKSELMDEADEALKALAVDQAISELLQVSKKQVFVLAQYFDEATGLTIPVKALIDLVPDKDSRFGNCLGDFKTAVSGEPGRWSKAVNEHDYHTQGSIYIDAYNKATKEERTDWLFAIQENGAPFQTARRILSVEFLDLGQSKYLLGLRRYAKCLSRNHWPDYDEEGGFLLMDHWRVTEPLPWMMTTGFDWSTMPVLKPITAKLSRVTEEAEVIP